MSEHFKEELTLEMCVAKEKELCAHVTELEQEMAQLKTHISFYRRRARQLLLADLVVLHNVEDAEEQHTLLASQDDAPPEDRR